jgi:hypothetical protein
VEPNDRLDVRRLHEILVNVSDCVYTFAAGRDGLVVAEAGATDALEWPSLAVRNREPSLIRNWFAAFSGPDASINPQLYSQGRTTAVIGVTESDQLVGVFGNEPNDAADDWIVTFREQTWQAVSDVFRRHEPS